MAAKIVWREGLEQALSQAKVENKHVFLDFFNPLWLGCQQMDAVTYPNQHVIREVNKCTVPLRVHHKTEPLATEFNIRWTPTLIILDADGREHHRTVGYLSPEEFIPWLCLGTAKSHFDREELGPALELLDELLSKYPESDSAPEAIYLRGVSRYQLNGDHSDLSAMREAYQQLNAKFPGNEWTKRATVYQSV